MTIRCVLFDLDGTFADTAPDLHQALNFVLTSRGHEPIGFEQLRPVVSHGTGAMLRVGFGIETDDPGYAQLKQDFLDYYLANIDRYTRLFEGMDELLGEFAARSIAWGVVTNKPAWLTDPLMAALGLDERAACIVSGDTTAYAKPHPEPILHACRQIGIDPAQTLYVGDAQRDIQSGKQAGTKTLVALFGYFSEQDRPETWEADGMISHPRDIVGWLD